MRVTIYHNPLCSKSREVLALIHSAGIEPEIIEYLKTPLSAETVRQLIHNSGLKVREAIRTDVESYTQHIADKPISDEAIIDLIVQDPRLLNRPFVQTDKGARLCRPPETVLALL